jgi:hypothetical protein
MSNLKKAALAVGMLAGAIVVLIAFMVACNTVTRVMFPERWKEIDAEMEASRAARKVAKEKEATSKKAAASPSGATIAGGLAAMDLAKAGALKPSSQQVEALGRRAASEMNVKQGDRRRFVGEFEHGFWVGWKTATQ